MATIKRNPRPKKYASAAERQAAYRARYAVIELRLEHETVATLDRIGEHLDISRNEVVNQILKFGLLNRNWFTEGRFTKWLPHENVPAGNLGLARRVSKKSAPVDDSEDDSE